MSGNAVEASLIAGVALAQLGGTDNLPTVCALPRAADAALAPKPGATCPGEDSPPFSDPNAYPVAPRLVDEEVLPLRNTKAGACY